MPGRVKGSKNRKTLERERAKKLASVRAELAKKAPPIDYAASYDSLVCSKRSCAVSTSAV
jgi:hypothetical protein